MISENLLCSSLPSPVLRQAPRSQSEPEPVRNGRGREEYGYFPTAPQSVGSVGSSESDKSRSSKRGSVGERSIRWKGLDV
jgi:hypothetical protein